MTSPIPRKPAEQFVFTIKVGTQEGLEGARALFTPPPTGVTYPFPIERTRVPFFYAGVKGPEWGITINSTAIIWNENCVTVIANEWTNSSAIAGATDLALDNVEVVPLDSVPDDFTVFRSSQTLGIAAALSAMEKGNSKLGKSGDIRVPVYSDQLEFGWKISTSMMEAGCSVQAVRTARALGCYCWGKKKSSITLRVSPEEEKILMIATSKETRRWVRRGNSWCDKGPEQIDVQVAPEEVWLCDDKPRWEVGKGFGSNLEPDAEDSAKPYLFSKFQIARELFSSIFFPDDEHVGQLEKPCFKHGLIVISGQTGSLKSEVLRLLLKLYLAKFDYMGWGKKRYPHILTLEDPIEKPIIPFSHTSLSSGIDFTPREIGKDVTSLSEGLLHALRQTPTAVVVGETREVEDWKELLKFAGTGHLCFTTTHAGSLVETMRKIIEATGATTSDLRSSMAEKVIAVVHLKQFSLEDKTDSLKAETSLLRNKTSMLLPALWRNVHGGANFFVSDGLSAILPRRTGAREKTTSCRGRADFARWLVKGLLTDDNEIDYIEGKALESDLKGEL